ncbi:MAG: shikimate kinase [Eubacterium sp.]|nr:shikimate kinase [Eubacterium sp.]
MNNVVLIGMPGCGKSTAGVLLAKTLRKSFVDTDLLIQKFEGKALQEIIDERGNAYFRDVEDAVISNFGGDNYVIATGGSAVYSHDNMQRFRNAGDTIVYIKVPCGEIVKRLSNIATRGVTLAPGQTIEDLYNERIPLYEKEAALIVDTDGLDLEQTVTAIAEALGSDTQQE